MKSHEDSRPDLVFALQTETVSRNETKPRVVPGAAEHNHRIKVEDRTAPQARLDEKSSDSPALEARYNRHGCKSRETLTSRERNFYRGEKDVADDSSRKFGNQSNNRGTIAVK